VVTTTSFRSRHHERFTPPIGCFSRLDWNAKAWACFSVCHIDELILFFQDLIIFHSFFASQFKEYAAIKRVVEIEKLCIILSDFRTVVILVVARPS
jgi:hypothetical protein